MLDHRRAHFAAEAGDDVNDARGNAAVGQRLHEVQRRERRVLRRLDHRGVAGDQGREELPRRNRHREIPRRDHGADAERLANGHSKLVGQLRRHRRPKQAAAFAGGVIAAIDGFLNVTARFLDDLAHLARHQLRILFLARDQDLRRLVQHLSAARCGHQSPRLEGLLGRLDGCVHIFTIGPLEDADHLARVGRIQVLESVAGVALHPLAVDKVLINARLSAGVNARRFLFHRCHNECLLQ